MHEGARRPCRTGATAGSSAPCGTRGAGSPPRARRRCGPTAGAPSPGSSRGTSPGRCPPRGRRPPRSTSSSGLPTSRSARPPGTRARARRASERSPRAKTASSHDVSRVVHLELDARRARLLLEPRLLLAHDRGRVHRAPLKGRVRLGHVRRDAHGHLRRAGRAELLLDALADRARAPADRGISRTSSSSSVGRPIMK